MNTYFNGVLFGALFAALFLLPAYADQARSAPMDAFIHMEEDESGAAALTLRYPAMNHTLVSQNARNPIFPEEGEEGIEPQNMSPPPDAPAVKMPDDWPTPASLRRRIVTTPQPATTVTKERGHNLWHTRRSSDTTLAYRSARSIDNPPHPVSHLDLLPSTGETDKVWITRNP